jgi:hypothetical protein
MVLEKSVAVNAKAGVMVRMNLIKLPGTLLNDFSANMEGRKSDHAIAKWHSSTTILASRPFLYSDTMNACTL